MRITLVALALGVLCLAQNFNSGSTGADGALNLATPGTVVLDPKAFNPPLDTDGDNIYHFTTINIGPGVTLKSRGDVLNGRVYFLAQGFVQIGGAIDLSGAVGIIPNSPAQRVAAIPGSGGYAGFPLC